MSGLIVCADDYAISEGTSRVILGLLADKSIQATSCLVETECWPEVAGALRALAGRDSQVAVGLHLNLTERFSRTAVTRPMRDWVLSAPLPAREIGAILGAMQNQWTLFCEVFGRPPDFIDGHQHIHLFPSPRRALARLIRETGFSGWVRQCRTASWRPAAKRLLLDPLSGRLAHAMREVGCAVNPGFGGLRSFRPSERVEDLWRVDLAAMGRGGVLMVHPGAAGSPPGTEGIDPCRIAEARLIADGVLARAATALGLTIETVPRSPGWG
jgi:predicted glycoside hydrolase/deacetylase ChbG (UPF0249 family)